LPGGKKPRKSFPKGKREKNQPLTAEKETDNQVNDNGGALVGGLQEYRGGKIITHISALQKGRSPGGKEKETKPIGGGNHGAQDVEKEYAQQEMENLPPEERLELEGAANELRVKELEEALCAIKRRAFPGEEKERAYLGEGAKENLGHQRKDAFFPCGRQKDLMVLGEENRSQRGSL